MAAKMAVHDGSASAAVTLGHMSARLGEVIDEGGRGGGGGGGMGDQTSDVWRTLDDVKGREKVCAALHVLNASAAMHETPTHGIRTEDIGLREDTGPTFNCIDDRVDDVSDGVKCADCRPNIALESLHRRVYDLHGAQASRVDLCSEAMMINGGMEVG